MKTLRIGLVQMSAGADVEENLAKVQAVVAPLEAYDLIALPEVFALRGGDKEYRHVAAPLSGRLVARVGVFAEKLQSWLLAGSVIERDGIHMYNTSVLFDRAGHVAAAYRKIHLFEAVLDDGQQIRESDSYEAGDTPVTVDIEGWRAGLSVCYDLRFPELYRRYAAEGADVLFMPSNFTQRTGRDHWDVLVRARAIENQCFVIAPDQCGANPVTGVVSHGHSLAVGPWGQVLAEAGDEECVLTVDLDPAELSGARERIPVLKHRVL